MAERQGGPVVACRREPTGAVARTSGRLRRAWEEARASSTFALPLLALSAASIVGTVMAPVWLHTHPLWVLALCPRPAFVLLAVDDVGTLPLVALLWARSLVADPFNYLAGRRWGPAVGRVAGRFAATRLLWTWLERLVDRFGYWVVLARSDGRIMGLAGARRLSPSRCALGAAAGGLAQYVLMVTAGPHVWTYLTATTASAARLTWSSAMTPWGAVGTVVALAAAAWMAAWVLTRRAELATAPLG